MGRSPVSFLSLISRGDLGQHYRDSNLLASLSNGRARRAGGTRAAASWRRELDTRVEELVGVLEHLAFVFQKRRSRASALTASARKRREKAKASDHVSEHNNSEIDHMACVLCKTRCFECKKMNCSHRPKWIMHDSFAHIDRSKFRMNHT